MNADTIQQCQVKIGQGRWLLVPNMPATLQSGSGAARDEDRKVIVVVEARIAHAAAIQINRMVE